MGSEDRGGLSYLPRKAEARMMLVENAPDANGAQSRQLVSSGSGFSQPWASSGRAMA